MPTVSVRALRVFCLLFVVGFVAAAARADLTWNPQTGWNIQGGALSGLTGPDGREALDLMNRARHDEEAGRNRAAIKLYVKVGRKYPSSIYAPEAFYRMGLIRWHRGEYYIAFEDFQAILSRYPNVTRYDELVSDQYKIASLLLDGKRNRLWGWLRLFPNRERAVAYFQVILVDAPYGAYAPLCLFDVALGEQYLGNTDAAIDALDRMVNNYSQSVLTPDAYLRLAELHASEVEGPYYDQGQTKQAITYDEDFMILYPTDRKIAEAATGLDALKTTLAESKVKMGDFYFYKRDNYTAARVFYNEAITSYPDSSVAKIARKRLNAVEVQANEAAQGRVRKKHFLFF
ncbi:MAG: tetratricopeptide repeat protein [Opitutaceae bacterium]